MITGDRRFGPGHPRYELQKSAVERLEVLYWGRGSFWPRLPAGKFDVVSTQDPFWRGLFAWYAARRLGARFNVQVHAVLSAQSFVKRVLARFILSRADSIRVVSERIARQLKTKNYKLKTPPIVLPVYVELGRFHSLSRRPEAHTVLWIGRFEPEKDPLLALAVMRKVPDAKLIVLGNGSLEQRLRSEISRFNLDIRVELPGWQDPLPYLARATAVLCTSRVESWGSSIVEALAAGVPVVAPDVGIAKEAGAVVAPRDRLAEALTETLRSQARGVLRLTLPSKEEWVKLWRASLE